MKADTGSALQNKLPFKLNMFLVAQIFRTQSSIVLTKPIYFIASHFLTFVKDMVEGINRKRDVVRIVLSLITWVMGSRGRGWRTGVWKNMAAPLRNQRRWLICQHQGCGAPIFFISLINFEPKPTFQSPSQGYFHSNLSKGEITPRNPQAKYEHC